MSQNDLNTLLAILGILLSLGLGPSALLLLGCGIGIGVVVGRIRLSV